MAQPSDLYPEFSVKHIQNPNRLYAVPLLGIAIKIVSLIPQFILLFFIVLGVFFMILLINPFVVLFTGKYWTPAYNLMHYMMVLSAKVNLYIFGLSDKYPGFSGEGHEDFTLKIPHPSTSNRLYAVPVFGGIARLVLLIPYFIFTSILQYAVGLGLVGASFVVLFAGKYPESIYEIARDYLRLNFAMSMYMGGLSDSYPSFWISMNHKNIKIALIALGALYFVLNMLGSFTSGMETSKNSYRNNNEINIENNVNLEEELESLESQLPTETN